MADSALKVTTVKRYLKEETDLRVSAPAAERLVQLVETQLEQVAGRAKELALASERNTLLDRDVDEAFDGWLKSSGPSLLSAEAMLVVLNGLSNETLAGLIGQLQDQLRNP